MKFIFDRAVKGRDEGYSHIARESFSGNGPWVKQGVKFSAAEDWFEHAKKIGRSLGIKDCECAILPPEGDTKKFIFSFKYQEDHMAFVVATSGDQEGIMTRNILFDSPAGRAQAIPKVLSFLKQNEISANIVNSSDPRVLRVITNSRLDDFAIAHACNQGAFAPDQPDSNPSSPAPQ